MYLQLLESLGTFFGGLGALTAATTQLLTFLQKKSEGEADAGEPGVGGDSRRPPMHPLKCLTYSLAI